MNVAFVNKYTVGQEGHSTYHHLKPEMLRPPAQDVEENRRVLVTAGRANSMVQIMGLVLALVIIFIAVVGHMIPILIIGIVLACMYALRIFQRRKSMKEKPTRVPPPDPMLLTPKDPALAGKWVRFVRFGDHIEVEDPGHAEEFEYDQITRISDDPAYLTLWMDNGSQVRVAKKGFTIGTLHGFEQFIEEKTNQSIGAPARES